MLNNAKIILKDGAVLNESNPRVVSSILKAQLHTYEHKAPAVSHRKSYNNVRTTGNNMFTKEELDNSPVTMEDFMAMLRT